MIKFIRSFLFFISFLLLTGILSLVSFIIIFLPSRYTINVAKFWSFLTLKLLKYICGMDVLVEGRENIPVGKFVIFASKHQSAWETIIYQYLLGNVIFMFKKELAYIPFFGTTIVKTGSIMVDRGNTTRAGFNKLVDKFKDALKSHNIVIFPEGTRTIPFAKPSYKSGLSIIAAQLKDEVVVPIAINSGLFWGKGKFLKTSGVVRVKILNPINTGNLSKEEFQKILVQEIEDGQKEIGC